MEFFTIGVYNSTEEDFFQKLKVNQIDTFCDIRQRRGVRGSKYAFVNSERLQAKLLGLNISYVYFKDLAPSLEIRKLQKKADLENHQIKRERQQLGSTFIKEYRNQIINNFDFDNFIKFLITQQSLRIVLFCVEENPEACHRSLIADHLSKKFKIMHL